MSQGARNERKKEREQDASNEREKEREIEIERVCVRERKKALGFATNTIRQFSA